MFSIVMPYYKNEHIVRRSIDSIVNQNYNNFELIIVDDGSSDRISEIVLSYNDGRIKLIHQMNRGVSFARNKAIEQCNGEYICFIDSDDSWHVNHLEVLNNMIEDYPDAGMWITSHERISERVTNSSVFLPEKAPYIYQPSDFLGLICDCGALIHTNSICLALETIRKTKLFNTNVSTGEDTDMWYRCILFSKPVITREITTSYYRDNSLLTKKRTFEYNWPFIHALDNIDTNTLSIETIGSVIFLQLQYQLSACKHYICEGEEQKAIELFKSIKKEIPLKLFRSKMEVTILLLLPKLLSRYICEKIYNIKNKVY